MASPKEKDHAPAPPHPPEVSPEELGQAVEMIRAEANRLLRMQQLLKAAETVYGARSIIAEVERRKGDVQREIDELVERRKRAELEVADVGRQIDAGQRRAAQAQEAHELRLREFDQAVQHGAAEEKRRLEAVRKEVELAIGQEREKLAHAVREREAAEKLTVAAQAKQREVQRILAGIAAAGAPN